MSDSFEGSVPARLGKNVYEVDEGSSHIEANQEVAKATGAGKVLVKVCPAHIYSEEPDGTISVEFAACLECGTCRAVAAPGLFKWHYPEGSMGVIFREGWPGERVLTRTGGRSNPPARF